MRRLVITSLFILLIAGCKKQATCDPADSEAVCKGFQDCLRSDTSAEVCRTAEQDANKIGKPQPKQ